MHYNSCKSVSPLVNELINLVLMKSKETNSDKVIFSHGLYGIACDIEDFYGVKFAKINKWGEHEYCWAVQDALEEMANNDLIIFDTEKTCFEEDEVYCTEDIAFIQ